MASAAVGLVAASDDRPVDDRPDVLDVVGATVLIAEVVGVLPYVDTEEGTQPVYYGVAAVGFLRQDELAIFLGREPHPTRAEERRSGIEELLLEGLEATPLSLNRCQELTRRCTTSIGGELGEVEVMVERLPSVVECMPFALADDLLE